MDSPVTLTEAEALRFRPGQLLFRREDLVPYVVEHVDARGAVLKAPHPDWPAEHVPLGQDREAGWLHPQADWPELARLRAGLAAEARKAFRTPEGLGRIGVCLLRGWLDRMSAIYEAPDADRSDQLHWCWAEAEKFYDALAPLVGYPACPPGTQAPGARLSPR